ncbi:MAG: hypothetical protein WKG00_40075 [Polyangiaceae bacterium]
MRSMGIFVFGYVLLLGGLLLALWKSGVLARVGSAWTAIGVLIALGVGVMLAVSRSRPRTIIAP